MYLESMQSKGRTPVLSSELRGTDMPLILIMKMFFSALSTRVNYEFA